MKYSPEELAEWGITEKRRASEIVENLRKAEKYFKEIADSPSEIFIGFNTEGLANLERKKAKAYELLDKNEELIMTPPSCMNPLLSKKIDQEYAESYYRDVRRFCVFCDEVSINFRIPMLPKKALRTIGKGSGIYQNNSRYLEIYLTKALDINEKIISGFLRKNSVLAWRKRYEFYYVYSENSLPIDTDSHDTKKTIDALSALFITGDTGITTSIYEKTFKSECIQQGTYIRIVSDDLPLATKESIEEIWCKNEKKWESKGKTFKDTKPQLS